MKMESLSQAFRVATCTVWRARTCVCATENRCPLYVALCESQDWHLTCALPQEELIHAAANWVLLF